MQKLIKKPGKDFIILNLTDIHMDNAKLQAGSAFLEILYRTMDELMARVKPDLVTITGDLAWGGHHEGQKLLVQKMDSYGIPWAPVFGNHDHDVDNDILAVFEEMLVRSPHCLYEAGDAALGNGNYTLLIEDEETGKPVEGLIFLDAHNRTPFPTEKDPSATAWAHLWDNQLIWQANEVNALKRLGCPETALFLHIPPYAYREAMAAAYRSDWNPEAMPPAAEWENCWNPGYENSSGVHYEGVGSYPAEDGALDAILAPGLTKYIFCGHEHINNWCINYRGVNLIYTLKTGCGAYWMPVMNGGTVIRVGAGGITSVEHEYISLPQELCDRA